jgi:two-component system sensor histidine kinase/response regulator
MKRTHAGSRKRIAWTAILVGMVLGALTYLFIRGVQNQLWQQSIRTIMESTQQGRNTLQIQLQGDGQSMGSMAGGLAELSRDEPTQLRERMQTYADLEDALVLYLPEDACLPETARRDEAVEQALQGTAQSGIVDPHISSVTGINVFDLYVKVTLQDGTDAALVKEYAVGAMVDSFSVSFYDDAGFSYVTNRQGDVLIRPPHPNSNKTVQNLFDMLSGPGNDADSVARFAQSLEESRTGWAVFDYAGGPMAFCYTPLDLETDWYFISIIPVKTINAQTQDILQRALLLMGCVILGLVFLAGFYLRYIKRAHIRLKNHAEYTDHLYNAIPEGIAIITVDPPYRFVHLNQEGLRLLCFPGENAIEGLCLQDVIVSEDYAGIAALFREAAVHAHKNTFEVRVCQRDGGYFWAAGIVERTLDEEGQPILITAIHDVTAEKLAEEEAEREKLQERLTLVRAISNAYPVIISLNLSKDTLSFVYKRPGLMLDMGTEKSYSELYRAMQSTIHPDSAAVFQQRFGPAALQATLTQKDEVYLEVKQRLSDGQYHWVASQIIAVDNPYSQDQLAILISRRVDEQRHEEEQRRQALQSALDSARAASEAKGQFLSNMSHDIRTPMNAIVGMTAIATAHVDDRERVVDCLRKISLSSKHLLSLINDVLDMSKVESGKLSLREEPFNFAQLVADAAELMRPQAEAGQLKLDVHLEPLKKEAVVGDALRVRQVLLNILSNAVKYTPAGGSIRLEARQEGGVRRGYQRYVFQCVDTGVGMSPAFLERLFQPFERSQDAISSQVTGTGLGMAITKNLVDLMNGEIVAESQPGVGSSFTVSLPLQLQDGGQEEVPEEWLGIRSLMVDDDQQTCENAVELLEDMGLRAQFVTEGAAAVRQVLEGKERGDPFRLVIVDWKMPDMDGVEVARRIRQEVGPEIPVIVLTAYDWSEVEGEARAAGVTAFITKPFYRSKACYLLHELSGEKQPVEPNGPVDSPNFFGKRALLVEDNEINREIARTLLEEAGVQVEEACDGEAAVSRVAGAEPGYYDLILMDIQMPRMDGYEATRRIRALPRPDAQEIPIVAMTANAFEEDVRAALRAGMNDHFAKPIDVKALEQLLRKYL